MLRSLVCCLGLVVALVPMAALADSSKDHRQAELANATAQLQLAQQDAVDLGDQAAESAANEREIALLKSEAMRQAQLDNAANASALEQMASSLAAAVRAQGQASAANELAILQMKAGALILKADANVANAMAIGRADEIANAQAQSAILHQLADYLTGVLAQTNMSSAEINADEEASSLVTAEDAEAANDIALGADDLLAADTEISDAQVAAESSELTGAARADGVLEHAEASLANAEEMLAEAP
jgi:hypothetical protein